MSAKLLLSETSRENRLRMRESSALSIRPSIATKTKIVVHINNYILPNEDTNKNLRSLASPASSIDYYETDFPRTEYRFNDSKKSKTKHEKDKEHEYMILKAKSLNFPIKVRSSYAIYQINEDNKKFTKDYNLIENKLSNIVNYEFYKKLPFLKASQSDQQQPQQTMRQMFVKDKAVNPNSLPHYLKPNHNLMPTYSIINKSKSDPKLAPVFSYKKEIKERKNNLIERFQKIDHLLKKREKKKNQENKTKPKEAESKPSDQAENKTKASASTNIVKKPTVIEPHPPPKKVSVSDKNEPAKKSTSDSFKLPFILKTFDPNEFSLSLTNHSSDLSQSVDNYAEYAQLNTLTEDMDEKINKIIKRYPSIVLRRQGNKSFPKLKKYLNDNHIKYEISYKNPTDLTGDTNNNNVAASITTNDNKT